MGAIATVHVDNGLPIGEGGNDAPPAEEAAANMRYIAACNPVAMREVLALARQAEALQQEVDSLKQTRQHSREASAALHDAFMEERKRVEALQRENAELAKSLLEVLNAVRDYLPPDGISAGDCLSRVIGAVDNSGINPLIKKLENADVDA